MHFAVRLDFFFFRAYNLLQWKIPNLSFVDWPWYFKNFERLAKKYLKGINFNFVKPYFMSLFVQVMVELGIKLALAFRKLTFVGLFINVDLWVLA